MTYYKHIKYSSSHKKLGLWLTKDWRTLLENTAYYFNNGDKYEGNFKNGMYEGKGIMYNNKEGEKYEGNFKNGIKEGKGIE